MNLKIEFKDDQSEDVVISYDGSCLWIERGNRSCVNLDKKSARMIHNVMKAHGDFSDEG